jgi:hypothetical protein
MEGILYGHVNTTIADRVGAERTGTAIPEGLQSGRQTAWKTRELHSRGFRP